MVIEFVLKKTIINFWCSKCSVNRVEYKNQNRLVSQGKG